MTARVYLHIIIYLKKKRISGAEDSIENIDTIVKESEKMQNAPNEKYAGNPGHNKLTRILQIFK